MSICLSQRLDLFVLSCLFLTVESHRGQVLPPQNVSLRWINDFQPELSWTPPSHSMENCEYKVATETTEQFSYTTSRPKSSPWNNAIVTGRGFLRITVKTICNETISSVEVSPPELDRPYPELVRDLSCYVYAANRAKCDWLPVSHARDVRFFYWLQKSDSSRSIYDPLTVPVIQECSQYHYNQRIKTGCDLEGGLYSMLYMSLNGTVNDTEARNTFGNKLETVRPPPLSWNVAKTGRKYFISWTPPDIEVDWVYILNYTECKETKTLEAKDGKRSIEFEAVPHCAYCMMIKAKSGERSETPWSQKECFDADADSSALLYVAVTIALVLGGLTALFFVCCRNNKEKIFPKVPEPVDLISDISENNNKNTLLSLCVLTAEEETCKITLVEDPFINKLDF